jgi:RNA polymerase sigma-70 factor, ECF subfamily
LHKLMQPPESMAFLVRIRVRVFFGATPPTVNKIYHVGLMLCLKCASYNKRGILRQAVCQFSPMSSIPLKQVTRQSDPQQEQFLVLMMGAQRVLHAFILKLVARIPDADDILQETNLVLWAKQAEFTQGTDFRAWAFQIARYQVMAYRKRRSLNRLVFDDELVDQLADHAQSREDHLLAKRELLADCLQKLSVAQRQLLADHYGSELSGREIAEKTGRKLDAVFQGLHRARESLIHCIERRLGEGKCNY